MSAISPQRKFRPNALTFEKGRMRGRLWAALPLERKTAPQKGLAGFIYAGFGKVFRGSQKPPLGDIRISTHGIGFFPIDNRLHTAIHLPDFPGLRQRAFSLFPQREDFAAIAGARKYDWAKNGEVCLTGVVVVPEKNAAVITTIQPLLDSTRVSAKLRRKYRNAHLATALAAVAYCRKFGLSIYAVHPDNYSALHHQTGQDDP